MSSVDWVTNSHPEYQDEMSQRMLREWNESINSNIDRIIEAARAKDAELIQMLVNALEYVASYDNGCPLPTWEKGYNEAWAYANAVRKDADALGFKEEDL